MMSPMVLEFVFDIMRGSILDIIFAITLENDVLKSFLGMIDQSMDVSLISESFVKAFLESLLEFFVESWLTAFLRSS